MSKEGWLRDAKSHLAQAQHILEDNPVDVQQLKAAAVQAQQAASELWKLVGIAYAPDLLEFAEAPPKKTPNKKEQS